jgi:polysaccharide biosynthesis protein PslF
MSLRKMFKKIVTEKKRVAYLSTYPPRECGIATFTKDLTDSIDKLEKFKPSVLIAINEKDDIYNYDRRVKWQIKRDAPESYIEVAEQINQSDIDVVSIQHEFGLFGGEFGDHIFYFLDSLKKPVVITLHTVQENFDPQCLGVLKGIVSQCDAVVVIARLGLKLLKNQGVVPKRKLVIPHGCPQVDFVSNSQVKESVGLKNRFVLTTFGLLSRGKGIEYAIQALPKKVEEEPSLIYLVIGETHPQIRKQEGETYRNKLVALVEELGLSDHVRFHNRFLSKRELIKYLQATDVYITPYVSADQVSSGTLAYAMGAGIPVISTPYIHAKEVLTDNGGLFCEFQNSDSIADCIGKLFDDDLRLRMAQKNYDYSRRFTWSNVAAGYADAFNSVLPSQTGDLKQDVEAKKRGIPVYKT